MMSQQNRIEMVIAFAATSCVAQQDAQLVRGDYQVQVGSHSLTYVGKHSNITDFRGYGQHLVYFPLFGLTSQATAERTDDRDVYHQGIFKQFEHHKLLSLDSRTFSPDAGGDPLGMRSIPGASDARENFDKAWATFITDALPDAPAPTIAPAASLDGWQLVRGTTTYTFEGRAAKTTLLAATRGASLVIVLATTVGTKYQKDVDRFFATLRFAAPAAPAAPATPAAPALPASPAPPAPATQQAPDPALSGAWGFSTGGAMGTGPYAAWLSDRREYAFDGSGNYTFLRRHNVDRDPDTSLIRERGTYTLTGDVLTLTPTKSEREVWSKVKSGANAGAYEKLLRREKVALEKGTYRIAYALYLDTQVPNLMLTSSAPTQRDGNFNATTQYRLFRPDGRYYTAVPPTP